VVTVAVYIDFEN